MSAEKAAYSREALCKALYHRLFLWIVNKINGQLAQEKAQQFIGVLDISGYALTSYLSWNVSNLCIQIRNLQDQLFRATLHQLH